MLSFLILSCLSCLHLLLIIQSYLWHLIRPLILRCHRLQWLAHLHQLLLLRVLIRISLLWTWSIGGGVQIKSAWWRNHLWVILLLLHTHWVISIGHHLLLRGSCIILLIIHVLLSRLIRIEGLLELPTVVLRHELRSHVILIYERWARWSWTRTVAWNILCIRIKLFVLVSPAVASLLSSVVFYIADNFSFFKVITGSLLSQFFVLLILLFLLLVSSFLFVVWEIFWFFFAGTCFFIVDIACVASFLTQEIRQLAVDGL